MNIKLLRKIQAKSMDKDVPEVAVGDTVEVATIIRDGNKQRIQKFKGMIIAIKGSGTDKTMTVRKISYGVGVEKILPIYSTNIQSIKVLKHAKVRRSKLYYMRDRIGKAAMKLKPGAPVVVVTGKAEEVTEENMEVVAEAETTDTAAE